MPGASPEGWCVLDSSTEVSFYFGAAASSWQVPAPLALATFMAIGLAILLVGLAKSA
jgi:hypothetical protein